jgi:hypothetical protein
MKVALGATVDGAFGLRSASGVPSLSRYPTPAANIKARGCASPGTIRPMSGCRSRDNSLILFILFGTPAPKAQPGPGAARGLQPLKE